MRIRRRLLDSKNHSADDEGKATQSPRRKNEGPAKKAKKPLWIKLGSRFQQFETTEVWYVPGARNTIVVCQLPAGVGGEWVATHLASGYVLFTGPSRKWVLKVCDLILDHCKLAKWIRGYWDDAKDAMGETVHGFLQHIWRAEYTIDELPTVKQWQKSGLKNSHKKLNDSRGRMTVKKRKRSD